MKPEFCTILKNYIEDHNRNIVGRPVWFCPNRNQSLKCVINDDGTISVDGFRRTKFKNAGQLIDSLKCGSIVQEGFKLPQPKVLKSISFSLKLFFAPNALEPVYKYISNPDLPINTNDLTSISGRSRICPGFEAVHPAISLINCYSLKIDGTVFRSRYCKRVKKVHSKLCNDCVKARSIAKAAIERKRSEGAIYPSIDSKHDESSRRRFSSLHVVSSNSKNVIQRLVLKKKKKIS